IVGCSMLGAGIWLRLAYGGYASLLHQYAAISADSLCLATGIITFVLAFCGCCGSWFQSRCMLITYFSLVVIVFALQLVAGTLAFAFRAEVSSTLISELQAGIRRSFNDTTENAVAITWNHLQSKFKIVAETEIRISITSLDVFYKSKCGLLNGFTWWASLG
ncbi:Tetraspanin-9, partial [Halocaridina rubra]